jgi:hypothetical protein
MMVVVFLFYNELRVDVYDPLGGMPLTELEVIKSKDKLR